MKKLITLALMLFAYPALAGEPKWTITCYLKGNVKPTIQEDVYKYYDYSSGVFAVQITPNGDTKDLVVGVNNCFLKKKTKSEKPNFKDWPTE